MTESKINIWSNDDLVLAVLNGETQLTKEEIKNGDARTPSGAVDPTSLSVGSRVIPPGSLPLSCRAVIHPFEQRVSAASIDVHWELYTDVEEHRNSDGARGQSVTCRGTQHAYAGSLRHSLIRSSVASSECVDLQTKILQPRDSGSPGFLHFVQRGFRGVQNAFVQLSGSALQSMIS